MPLDGANHYKAIAGEDYSDAEADPIDGLPNRAAGRLRRYNHFLVAFVTFVTILAALASTLVYLVPKVLLEPPASSEVAYADATFTSSNLPPPYQNHRFTVLHANVMNDTKGRNFVEILAFIENEHPVPETRSGFQIFAARSQSVFRMQECHFGSETSGLRAIERNGDLAQTNLFRCTIPASLSPADIDDLILTFQLHDGQEFQHAVHLSAYILPAERAKLGICVSPLHGNLDMFQLVEWRSHHARVGFKTVHFYERSAGQFNMSTWIDIWNARLGTRDTLSVAPFVSPSTSQTDIMLHKGVYADQNVWYTDCMARARHTSPTDWVAVHDLDEWYMPEHMDNQLATSIPDFFDKLDPKVASVNIRDTYVNGRPIIDSGGRQTPMLQMAMMSHYQPPANLTWGYATKAIHRLDAIQDPWIHWAENFREGNATDKLNFLKGEPGVPRFIHNRASFKQLEDYEGVTPVTDRLVAYLNKLWDDRDAIVSAFADVSRKA